MSIYIALLRGINVGGKNPIKMPDLAASFENLGFKHVSTYIQSGNVIFSADENDQDVLTGCIENHLSQTFSYSASVTLRSCEEMKAIVGNAPKGFGSDPAVFHYDVVFLKKPLTETEAIENVMTKPGVDRAYAANGVLYFEKLLSKATQSRLPRIVGLPIYQNMTIRNWNTTQKLLSMMEAVTG